MSVVSPGDWLAERWKLGSRVSARDGVERWRATSLDGEPVEVLVLTSTDPAARVQFTALHQELSRASDPALAKTLEVRLAGTTLFAVRAPLADATLADRGGLLPPGEVGAMGAALAPAVLAAGRATRGRVSRSDVAFDAQGRPMLAPLVEPRPPAPSEAEAALYSLGELLYELVTGRAPGRPPARPSSARAEVPLWLDEAILGLLSPTPSARVAAIAGLGGPTRARPTLTPPASAAPRAPSELRPRWERDPPALVVVPAGTALDPSHKSLLAGLAQLPIAAVDDLIRRRLPIVVDPAPSAEDARARAADLTRVHGVPFVPAWSGGGFSMLTRLFTRGLSLLFALCAALTFWLPPLALLLAVFAVATWWVGSLVARTASGRNFRDGISALAQIRRARAQREMDGALAAEWAALAALRVDVGRAEIPAAAGSDLRDAIRNLEAELEAAAGRADGDRRARVRQALAELTAAVAAVGADATEARLRALAVAVRQAQPG